MLHLPQWQHFSCCSSASHHSDSLAVAVVVSMQMRSRLSKNAWRNVFHGKLVRKCAQWKRHLIRVTKIKMLPEDDRQDGHQAFKYWAYDILRLSFTQNSTLIEEPCEKCTNYTSNNICTATHDTLRYVMRFAIIFIFFFLTISVGHFGLSFSLAHSLALPPTDASFSQPTRENLDLHLVPVNERYTRSTTSISTS